jgi:hypothetical protein
LKILDRQIEVTLTALTDQPLNEERWGQIRSGFKDVIQELLQQDENSPAAQQLPLPLRGKLEAFRAVLEGGFRPAESEREFRRVVMELREELRAGGLGSEAGRPRESEPSMMARFDRETMALLREALRTVTQRERFAGVRTDVRTEEPLLERGAVERLARGRPVDTVLAERRDSFPKAPGDAILRTDLFANSVARQRSVVNDRTERGGRDDTTRGSERANLQKSDPSSPRSYRSLTEAVERFRTPDAASHPEIARAIDQSVVAQQILRQAAPVVRAAGEPVFLLFPGILQGMLSQVEVVDYRPGRTDLLSEQEDGASESFHRVEFQVQLPNLGAVTARIAYRATEILLRIEGESEEARRFIARRVQQLNPVLRAIGFHSIDSTVALSRGIGVRPEWIQEAARLTNPRVLS